MSRKPFLAASAAALAALALGLSACGGSSSSGSAPAAASTESPAATAPATTAPDTTGSQSAASTVDVAVTHALFVGDALARIRTAGVRHVWSTDSVPHASNAISVVPLLAGALRAG